MPKEKSKPANTWKMAQVIGAIISILGMAILAYSGYIATSGPMVLRHSFNLTSGNATSTYLQFNQSMRGRNAAYNQTNLLDNMPAGVLMVLLGLVIIMYGRLKVSTMPSKQPK